MSYTKNILDKHLEIRYRGVFSFDDVYKTVRHWIDERRYDFMEGLYKDKVDTPFGNEVEIEMQPELKVTEFIKYHIYFTSKFTGVKEFTANINGEQKKVTDGRFCGRAPDEVVSDLRRRYEGVRVKHWVNRNSVKAYNKAGNVLRVEMTMNNTRDFKVFRHAADDPSQPQTWQKMRKGVSDLHRRAQRDDARPGFSARGAAAHRLNGRAAGPVDCRIRAMKG